MRLLPVGQDSLLIDLDGPGEAQAWHAELLRRRDTGTLTPVREIVPGEKTVLLYGVHDLPGIRAELLRWSAPAPAADSDDLVKIPVRYDGADLAVVAELWGMSEDDVVRVHSGAEYRVAFSGFAPGFAYLTGQGEPYVVPRRAQPRTSVPAGSVALAGTYTGIYPRSSPGGWQLIGRTSVTLWDLERQPAALLVPGTRVRFVPLSEEAAA
ncbi:allophanate hydrolase subunit 1 [Streptomyces viridochromogenes DSM 40736]|uniref:Allophanate hydrolase subunit 1 n=1 Tax=Streptomyces viridochromogenes (strain DSM 40736 / JCM 4977 / BCRC 1201 / Tue 494) TaxID=591159 RepID=D9X443_STRVT|nr:allophanate hydrolase subunit 1 [Streptomyces viridochromogenes]EFL35871.1 allophanate hydrolase subunit 1 [Streptomyces viridochromogenes DSM 40736]